MIVKYPLNAENPQNINPNSHMVCNIGPAQFNHIPGQLLMMCEPAREVICDSSFSILFGQLEGLRGGDGKIHHLPPPRLECSVGHHRFPHCCALPFLGRQHLILAGAGGTQQIRMVETYTPVMMKPARKVICD
jgi:hypothetical protein